MTLPNFLILGVAKSGTTSLYHYLKQHPEIHLSSIKEPNFMALGETPLDYGKEFAAWNRYRITTLEEYLQLFEGAGNRNAIGEASTTNRLPRACERIQHYTPNAKLIAILRQPVERAYSNFLHSRRVSIEPIKKFTDALHAETQRQSWPPWFWYGQQSFYFKDIQNFFRRFPRQQIRIYLYEDWQQQPLNILQDIFRFLGVDDQFIPDTSIRHNTAGRLPRSQRLLSFIKNPNHPIKNALKPLVPLPIRQEIVRSIRKANLTAPPPLDPKLRRQLTERYRDDIRQLETLIERDLSAWLV